MADEQRLPFKCAKRKRSTTNQSNQPERPPRLALSNGGNVSAESASYGPTPKLYHKVKNQKSILTLVVSDSKIYAGTQGGEILVSSLVDATTYVYSTNHVHQVWSLDTYELISTIPAHGGSILSLFISPNKELLFSSAGDAIVNVHSVSSPSLSDRLNGCRSGAPPRSTDCTRFFRLTMSAMSFVSPTRQDCRPSISERRIQAYK